MTSRWQRPANGDVWIMGVLNCTPDSFSDGGSFVDVEKAVTHGLTMKASGAAIVDVGGESTRPGSRPVALEDELQRVIPVVKGLVAAGCLVSIDTMKAEVMSQAVEAGAGMVNDVSALIHDADSLRVVAESGVDVCLMHMQGAPETMQQNPKYSGVLDEVALFFEQRIESCLKAGVAESSILLDPGIGFGKRLEDNLALIRGISEFKRRFSMPVLLGVSRKSFIGQLTGSPVEDREIETAVAGAIGILQGTDIVRVHDVSLQARAIRMASALSTLATGPDASILRDMEAMDVRTNG
ncbi:Dihydropteroate synthase [Mariprofundus aestuarium]|uniref:Dihydropteroate synthase n=1 Tax=Mariprofundus aestuarium TaxID=1921086 RepID=A0A2K8KZW2_MARES|nr:dihydropteroate synthase [Mariprofundus aestuarium]ATX80558.1 Dihydropteroate synthase [Mariprofundus aestuarium]